MTTRSASLSLAAWRRSAAATLVSRLVRNNRNPALRIAARISGASPVRTRQASSPRLPSRTQCKRFSIWQCPRAIASNRLADPRSGPSLVNAQTVSLVTLPGDRRRASSHNCAIWVIWRDGPRPDIFDRSL